MIKATAQGVRLIKSKLRYNLSDHTFVNVSLVLGRGTWRIVSAQPVVGSPKFAPDINHSELEFLVNVSNLIIRLIQGEEKNELLYGEFLKVVLYLTNNKLGKSELSSLEIIAVAKILYTLGYWKFDGETDHLIEDEIGSDLLVKASGNKKKIIRQINEAIKETQL